MIHQMRFSKLTEPQQMKSTHDSTAVFGGLTAILLVHTVEQCSLAQTGKAIS